MMRESKRVMGFCVPPLSTFSTDAAFVLLGFRGHLGGQEGAIFLGHVVKGSAWIQKFDPRYLSGTGLTIFQSRINFSVGKLI
jgi:hypothetical protein